MSPCCERLRPLLVSLGVLLALILAFLVFAAVFSPDLLPFNYAGFE